MKGKGKKKFEYVSEKEAKKDKAVEEEVSEMMMFLWKRKRKKIGKCNFKKGKIK